MQTGDFISSHRTMPTCRNAAEAGFLNGFQSGSDGISAEECYDVLLLEIDRHSRVDTRRRTASEGHGCFGWNDMRKTTNPLSS